MQKATGRFWRDNGLSLVLVCLFLLFFGGQTYSGWLHYNEELEEHQQAPVGLLEYVRSGAFGEAVFENWESEFLQMGLYVFLTTFLFQRGSAESKDPDESEEDESRSFDREHSPLAARKGGLVSKLYSHSLGTLLRSDNGKDRQKLTLPILKGFKPKLGGCQVLPEGDRTLAVLGGL